MLLLLNNPLSNQLAIALSQIKSWAWPDGRGKTTLSDVIGAVVTIASIFFNSNLGVKRAAGNCNSGTQCVAVSNDGNWKSRAAVGNERTAVSAAAASPTGPGASASLAEC